MNKNNQSVNLREYSILYDSSLDSLGLILVKYTSMAFSVAIKSYNVKEDLPHILRPRSIVILTPEFYQQSKVIFDEALGDKKASESLVSLILVYRHDQLDELNQFDDLNIHAVVEDSMTTKFLPHAIENELHRLDKLNDSSRKVEENETDQLGESLLKIGMEIGAHGDTIVLLKDILVESMMLCHADAGSLALRGFDSNLERADENILTFYTSFNFSKEIEFNRFSLELNEYSLAGYSVLNSKILNIEDAYLVGDNKTYKFNDSFDKQTGFRTKSMLVVPMINNDHKVFGIIQLINKKQKYNEIIDYENLDLNRIHSFTYKDESNLQGVANFASIALENAILYKEIEISFESYVRASVYAVEQRDPATSGHSDRVAGYCVSLADACNKAKGELENFNFNENEVRELRYAALLHDFGKIGVREKVLVKQKKLEDYELNDINRKFKIYLLQKDLEVEREKIELIKNNDLSIEELDKKLKQLEERLAKEYEQINYFLEQVTKSNEPTVFEEGSSQVLEEINQIILEIDNEKEKLLTDREYQFLQIKRGSLSETERLEIESHVTHSFKFLEKIPWGGNLRKVPEIAYGHHEKLNGTGYPRGIESKNILPQTKIMTVSDIFDALVASDRPYKKALTIDEAIKILNFEANDNKIDRRIVDLMVSSKTFKLFQK